MARLTDYTSYADAHRHFSSAALWELFDGDRQAFNLAHECVDRHAAPGRVAVRVAHADGRDETITFAELSASSSRFAHWLAARGVGPATAWPSCSSPRWPSTPPSSAPSRWAPSPCRSSRSSGPTACASAWRIAGRACSSPTPRRWRRPAPSPASTCAWPTTALHGRAGGATHRTTRCGRSADDLAVFQYTSGTTRELPAAVRHTQRAVVVLMVAALYGTGIRPGDRYFCPSSPAWGHGLWHGTLAPLAMGVTTGTMAGKFEAGAPAPRAPGLRGDQPVGRGHPLPDDEELRRDAALSLRHPQAVLHRRAHRQRHPRLRGGRASTCPCAACTAPPRWA